MLASDRSSSSPTQPSSTLETRTRRPRDRISHDPSPRSQTSQSSVLTSSTNIEREISNVNDPSQTSYHGANTDDPKLADETVSNPLFPPLPTHYHWSTIVFYRVLSMILSVCFLVFVMACAMAKTVPSMAWTVWSWCQLKDPNRFRPFYKLEKERKGIATGKLKCDIGYYAERVGLDCDEMQIESEDGFILTIQHIVDRSLGAIDPKRITPILW